MNYWSFIDLWNLPHKKIVSTSSKWQRCIAIRSWFSINTHLNCSLLLSSYYYLNNDIYMKMFWKFVHKSIPQENIFCCFSCLIFIHLSLLVLYNLTFKNSLKIQWKMFPAMYVRSTSFMSASLSFAHSLARGSRRTVVVDLIDCTLINVNDIFAWYCLCCCFLSFSRLFICNMVGKDYILVMRYFHPRIYSVMRSLKLRFHFNICGLWVKYQSIILTIKCFSISFFVVSLLFQNQVVLQNC